MRHLGTISMLVAAGLLAGTLWAAAGSAGKPAPVKTEKIVPVVLSDAGWQKHLTPEQFRVLRREGTEIAFTGKYWNHHERGAYVCAGCGLELFSSAAKYESGTGWPSFWQPVSRSHVREVPDNSFGMMNTEIECARCGGHLGHVFPDGPRPTGLRYCMNSVAMKFIPAR
ncbi:MAG: peptide-methionine (R)-S-oxide reductase MsrB [Candidatus Eisenbacteria bacterium]